MNHFTLDIHILLLLLFFCIIFKFSINHLNQLNFREFSVTSQEPKGTKKKWKNSNINSEFCFVIVCCCINFWLFWWYNHLNDSEDYIPNVPLKLMSNVIQPCDWRLFAVSSKSSSEFKDFIAIFKFLSILNQPSTFLLIPIAVSHDLTIDIHANILLIQILITFWINILYLSYIYCVILRIDFHHVNTALSVC